MSEIFNAEGADIVLGAADNFITDWEDNGGAEELDCIELRRMFDAYRPLFLAAPDMLAALKETVEKCAHLFDARVLRAAIAKAEGEL